MKGFYTDINNVLAISSWLIKLLISSYFSQSHACRTFSYINGFINCFEIFKLPNRFIWWSYGDIIFFVCFFSIINRGRAPQTQVCHAVLLCLVAVVCVFLVKHVILSLKSCAFLLFSRPMVPQLAPPKIPEGERVDFDVSYEKEN